MCSRALGPPLPEARRAVSVRRVVAGENPLAGPPLLEVWAAGERREVRASGNEKDPSRTRQSLVTLASFPTWGSWPGWRHARSRPSVYREFTAVGTRPRERAHHIGHTVGTQAQNQLCPHPARSKASETKRPRRKLPRVGAVHPGSTNADAEHVTVARMGYRRRSRSRCQQP